MNFLKGNRKWHWVFWSIYFLINHLLFAEDRFSFGSLLTNLLFTVHNAGTAYVTLDWWIPKFYNKRKYVQFIIATFSTIVIFSILLTASLFPIYNSFDEWHPDIYTFLSAFNGSIFWSNFSGITFLIIPYFLLQRIEMENRNRQLEKEKLEAELKFLKSQLHPHFLFNALNNIYFLIKKDPDTAAEALAGFSNLLRFQLYDANSPRVSLNKEIEYLQQFADIAKLRKGANFKVNWDLESDTKNLQIASLLLMPLMENAFKHGSNKNGKIDIELKVNDNQQLQLRIANSIEKNKSLGIEGFEEGGIGLINIQKRLKLIYPNRHKFSITDTATEYIVDLKVTLEVLAKESTQELKIASKLNQQTTV